MRGVRRAIAATLLCLGLGASTALIAGQSSDNVAQESRVPFQLRPGVVVDPGRGLAFVMAAQGGIEALDLTNGKPRWTTGAAHKPLALDGDLLWAQAESPPRTSTLVLVALDLRRPAEPRIRTTIELPADVSPAIEQSLGAAFDVSARIVGSELIVRWRFTPPAGSGGARDETTQRGAQPSSGAARVDPSTGQARIMKAEEVPDPEPLPSQVTERAAGKGFPWPPRRVGDLWVAVERVDPASRRGLVLLRWQASSGAALPPVGLCQDDYFVTGASADGGHVLISRVEAPPRQGQAEEFLWSIHSSQTGAQVGQVRAHQSGARFFVIGSDLVYESRPQGRRVGEDWITEPLALVAVDLAQGEQRWARPLRDTIDRGPLPPFP